MWRFRLTHVDLKPGVDPEVDYRGFSGLVRSGILTWILRDSAGVVRGIANFIPQERQHDGRRFVFLLPEYIYVDPGYRKGAGLAHAAARALWRTLRRWPGLPIYIGGPGYMGGFLMACQLTDPVWLWGDPGMSKWEAGAFAALVGEVAGWDATTGVVTMKTRPRSPRTTPPTDARLRTSAARYTAKCPRWTEGYTAFCFARLGWGSAAVFYRSLLRRAGKAVFS
jgi:hypothetical protein